MIRYVASGQEDCSGRMLNEMQHKFSTYLCIVIQQVHLHNMVRIKGGIIKEISLQTQTIPIKLNKNMHQPNTFDLQNDEQTLTVHPDFENLQFYCKLGTEGIVTSGQRSAQTSQLVFLGSS